MFENLTLVAVIVIVLWLASLSYYWWVSSRNRTLADDITKLEAELDRTEKHNRGQ